jgi:hypothetical protein
VKEPGKEYILACILAPSPTTEGHCLERHRRLRHARHSQAAQESAGFIDAILDAPSIVARLTAEDLVATFDESGSRQQLQGVRSLAHLGKTFGLVRIKRKSDVMPTGACPTNRGN